MKRAIYMMVVAFACMQLVGCETHRKHDGKHAKMDCCGEMTCCEGMKTDGVCSKDCKAACCD